jgi:hypothetical protein
LDNAAGPLVGGPVTETVGSRWIFWLNVPLTLTALVTPAGVGVAAPGTVLEMIQPAGMSSVGAVDAIVLVLAALLPAAGAVVLFTARVSSSDADG